MFVRISKLLLSLLTSKEGRKILLVVVVVITMPFWLTMFVYSTLNEEGSLHNKHLIDTEFNDLSYDESLPDDYKNHLEQFKLSFDAIDNSYKNIKNLEGEMDIELIKIILFSFKFEDSNYLFADFDSDKYINCFIDYIDKEIIIVEDDPLTSVDEETKQIITKAIPIKDFNVYITNVSIYLGVDVDSDKQMMISQIKNYLNSSSNEGESLAGLLNELFIESESKEYVGGTFGSPFIDEWNTNVTSEYGPREPFLLPNGKTTSSFHTGIDLAREEGTSLLAVNDGVVILTKYTNEGLGIYCVVDHGGGVITVYGHCSKLLVFEGQRINKGDVIAEVGSTGNSTGNHVHFMVYKSGETENPRNWLP
jgi:murein DD-endopeptidase MepM/ murein hydrolase activator NlpD